MADDSLGEHPVSISGSETVGSQGISGSSLVSSTSSSSVLDGGLTASRCSESGVNMVSPTSSRFNAEGEGASFDGHQGASRCSKVAVEHSLT
eukprot:4331174-Ditylum_brightwellii.AAC.1